MPAFLQANIDLQALGLLFSLVTLLVSLSTRAGLAELNAELTKEQEARCKNCRDSFITAGEFEQLGTRVGNLEGKHG